MSNIKDQIKKEKTSIQLPKVVYDLLKKDSDEANLSVSELVILSIDRLGRNKNATKREYNKLINKGVKLTFLEDPKLNSDVYNEEELDVKTYMAEQECKMIKKRSKQGIDAMPADKNGRKYSSKTGNYIGRPSAKYPNNFTEVYNKWKEEEISANDAIKMCGISKGTFYKLVHKYEEENKIV